ncbi:heavy metal translocating P-type ATPase [Facklamia sp. 7083-14-GEN3]|uniref:heavy metal translocating P-type ATPase n=1 Tax=Facklamia sp. 7083-14-GEN3 TaxID=2973478 RepID=UPI00215BA8DC|nr:heavy metal translocating P-type ATPase [Facklamia sp. 7083-14-GEN3]MCR8968452.1 heavy metal translocating P-type ATPase [Facklamia sp. 7083-14-GEN3]
MKFNICHQNQSRLRVKSSFLLTPTICDYLKEKSHSNAAIQRIVFYSDQKTLAISVNKDYEISQAIQFLKSIEREKINQLLEKPYYKEKTPYAIISKELSLFALRRLLLPNPIQYFYTIYQSSNYLKRAIKALINKNVNMDVLDGAAIITSILIGQPKTASSIMFIMGLGDQLNDWTNKKSIEDLENSLKQQKQMVWVLDDKGVKVERDTKQIKMNDIVVFTEGSEILFDGVVHSGSGMVNESSLTGEFFPVMKQDGDEVFSNTILEMGELYVQVTNTTLNNRIHELMELMRKSEANSNTQQNKYIALADKLVKYNFLGVVITYLLTGSLRKALSFLLVDFSCALKLSIPISYLSAIKDAVDKEILIKSMAVVEKYNDIDLVVFDKTGTLTISDPKVVQTISFHDYSKDEVLRIGACLEEHIYHPLANAVVTEAKVQSIVHDEMHGQLHHIASRGILSTIDEKEVVIGSYLLMKEKKIAITQEQEAVIEQYEQQYNLLYLGYDGKLIGLFLIDTPLREDTAKVIQWLQDNGKEVALLTGDTQKRTQSLIDNLYFHHIKTEVSPSEKYQFIKEQKDAGKKVMMLGDGLNDSAALSLADIGCVMNDAADICKQTSDLVLSNNQLGGLMELQKISSLLEKRIKKNLKETIGINSCLIILGVFDLLSPSALSILHNLTTTGIILRSMSGFKAHK